MQLDELAAEIRRLRLVLAYSQNGTAKLAFRYTGLPKDLRRALRNRRRGLHRLMVFGDVRLCPTPVLHRKQWRYAGRGRYQCEACCKLDSWQRGLWAA